MAIFYICVSVLIILALVVVYCLIWRHWETVFSKSKQKYKETLTELETLEEKKNAYKKLVSAASQEYSALSFKRDAIQGEITTLAESLDNFKQVTSSAKEEYFENLEQSYEANTQELQDKIGRDKKILLNEISELQEKKEQLDAAVTARIEADKREKTLQASKENYMIPCALEDIRDIEELNNLKKRLSKPRILSMLIWQTYYQKPLKTLCNNILGIKTKTGIYKITNQKDQKCYIGQAVDIASRWIEHVKCGCGIDTPQGNKLYAAMQADGVYNFTFELLEECPRDQLNEKEKEYIALYQSKDFGYNTLAGISKRN